MQGLFRTFIIPKIEVVVLGCTHFPFVQPLLEELTSGRIWFIDPAFETSELVRHRLESKNLFNPQDTGGTVKLYFTKDIELGDTLSASFLDTSRRTMNILHYKGRYPMWFYNILSDR